MDSVYTIESATQKEIIQGLADVKIVFDYLNVKLTDTLKTTDEADLRAAFEYLDDMGTEINTLRQAMNKVWVELNL